MSSGPLTSGTDYVSHLEAQLENHDQERSLLIGEFDKLKSNFRQVSDFREELRAVAWRRDQVTNDLMEEKLIVQEEREKVARLLDENAVLQAQSDDDRVKIASLIGLCQGVFVSSSSAGGVLGAGVGDGGSMYAQRHLHVDPRNAFEAKKHQEKESTDREARGGSDCLPVGHLPIRRDASAPSRAPLRPKTGGGGPPATTTMSLRNVVTDFANKHPHSVSGACHRQAAEPQPTARQPNNNTNNNAPPPPLQQFGVVDPRGVVCRNNGGGGGVSVAVDLALQMPVGSQLTAALSTEVHNLNQLLDEQRKTYEQDRTRRMQAEQLRVDRYIDSDRQQLKVIKRLEDDVQVAVKELCLYRHQQQIIERSLRGEIEMLKVQCLETKRDLTHRNSQATYDLTLALELATNKSEGAVAKLKSELVGKRQSHMKEREDLQQLVQSLQAENRDLLDKLDGERKMRKRGEERFQLEKEGMRSEVLQLKQHLRAMEKRMYFTHMKQETNATSAAQLLASLVTDQYAQQLANEQNKMQDDQGDDDDDVDRNDERGVPTIATKAVVKKTRVGVSRRRPASQKRKPLANRCGGNHHVGGSSSCPACGAIEERARNVLAEREREERRREPLSAAAYY